MEEKKYVITTESIDRVAAYMQIFDHYFENYVMVPSVQNGQGGMLYNFFSSPTKENEDHIRHDIRQLSVPPTLRIASDGTEYLQGLKAH